MHQAKALVAAAAMLFWRGYLYGLRHAQPYIYECLRDETLMQTVLSCQAFLGRWPTVVRDTGDSAPNGVDVIAYTPRMNRGGQFGGRRRGYAVGGFSTDNFSDPRPVVDNFLLKNGTFVNMKEMQNPTKFNITARRDEEERQKLQQM